ncbi:GNAT family N-acetyltransferase [Bacillus sp. SG-1]|uniref:GNAT family N-acetyltransferase n=1 Tax=Bacillus sp. SG-1 TaxID=161544 RepID=UPI0001544DE3|nr:GNAT family protein [Bacillus sp. SG-1]EDL64503.1 ribosomal-protein-alanine acetyltransferase [Bacillus sp. SG-1]
MEFTLRKRTSDDIEEFLTWTYDGIYAFYDNDIQQEKIDGFRESIDSDRAFSVFTKDGTLAGNCEFFNVADDDDDEVLAVGVQMKPSLTGKGYGSSFMDAIINEGRGIFKYDHLELAVVDFNKRAIKLYENAGFKRKGEFQNEIRGTTYDFIIMEKDWT